MVCVSNATRSVTKRKERSEIHESSETRLEGSRHSKEGLYNLSRRYTNKEGIVLGKSEKGAKMLQRVSECHEGSQTSQDESQIDREASQTH